MSVYSRQLINVGLILFYPKQIIYHHLQESLANILPKFYLLAGRYIKNHHSVAEFVQAEAVQADLLAKPQADDRLNDLLPRPLYHTESSTDPLLAIQITEFNICGRPQHLAQNPSGHSYQPGLEIQGRAWKSARISTCHKLFPLNPSYGGPVVNQVFAAGDRHPTILKRFSFNKESIAKLRSKLSNPNYYSRVRVVCAVLGRALIALDRNKHGRSRACIIAQAFDRRGRMVPPLPQPSCGNLSTISLTRRINSTETEQNLGIQKLVDLLADGLQRTIADCAEMLAPGEDRYGIHTRPAMKLMKELASGDVNFIMFTDWSKFGFYEADFGWGKPVGVGAMPAGEISILLMNNKEGDGMEAWLSLDCNDMAYLEQDEEINKLSTN